VIARQRLLRGTLNFNLQQESTRMPGQWTVPMTPQLIMPTTMSNAASPDDLMRRSFQLREAEAALDRRTIALEARENEANARRDADDAVRRQLLAQIARLESELATVRASANESDSSKALRRELAAAHAQEATQRGLDALHARIAELEAALSTLGDVAHERDALRDRVAELESASLLASRGDVAAIDALRHELALSTHQARIAAAEADALREELRVVRERLRDCERARDVAERALNDLKSNAAHVSGGDADEPVALRAQLVDAQHRLTVADEAVELCV
jgi:chromosome segregation ATPase